MTSASLDPKRLGRTALKPSLAARRHKWKTAANEMQNTARNPSVIVSTNRENVVSMNGDECLV